MAPRRFFQTNTPRQNYFYNEEQTFFETPLNSFQSNFRSPNWEQPRINNSNWDNSPQFSSRQDNFYREEQNNFYNNSPQFSEQTWERRVSYNQERISNNFQRGNNRFPENYGGRGFNNNNSGNWRFSPSPRVEHNQFSPGFQRQNIENSFVHDRSENNGFYNQGNNFESDFVNINNRNEENYNFHDDVLVGRNEPVNNWMSFENEVKTNIENVNKFKPKRGRGGRGGRGGKFRSNFKNAPLNRVVPQKFKGIANRQNLRKTLFKKKFNKSRGQKKEIKSRFQHILDGFKNGIASEKTSSEISASNYDDDYIIIDQTCGDNKNENAEQSEESPESKENEEILISDSNDATETSELVKKDGQDENESKDVIEEENKSKEVIEEENKSKEVIEEEKPVYFCEMCKVYCRTASNFEIHNNSNNHLFKLEAIKAHLEKENRKVELELEVEMEKSDKFDEDEIQIEADDSFPDNDILELENSNDEVVEVGTKDGGNKVTTDQPWNPDVLYGKSFMIQYTGYYCKVCKKDFKSTKQASSHCRSLSHFENCLLVDNGNIRNGDVNGLY